MWKKQIKRLKNRKEIIKINKDRSSYFNIFKTTSFLFLQTFSQYKLIRNNTEKTTNPFVWMNRYLSPYYLHIQVNK